MSIGESRVLRATQLGELVIMLGDYDREDRAEKGVRARLLLLSASTWLYQWDRAILLARITCWRGNSSRANSLPHF